MAKNWTEKIDEQISNTQKITHSYKPSESIVKVLGNKAVYIKSDMDADADGSPRAKQIDEFGRFDTALSRDNGWLGDGKFVDAEKIPYIVLPGKFNLVTGSKCRLGDLALVRHKGKEAFAIYADVGPVGKIGEGSIILVESLGANPWNRTKTKIVSGIGFGVECLVFPRSSETFGIPKTFDEIQNAGQKAFDLFFGGAHPAEEFSMTDEELQARFREGDIPVSEIMTAPEFKTLTDLNLRKGIGAETERITTIPSKTVVKTAVVSENGLVKNVGANENGLWLKVKFGSQTGFVRGSTKFLLPINQA